MTVILLFVAFTLAAAGWIRLYFNKYEPVYVETENYMFVKNHIASRFCKIIVSNTITDNCLADVSYIGLWTIVVKNAPSDDHEIKSVSKLHESMLESVEHTLTTNEYTKLKNCLDEIELNLVNNLDDSNILTPPYLSLSTYILWVESAIEAFKRS